MPPAVLAGPGIGWNNQDNIGPNWAILMLPFIEQDNLFRQVQASVQNYQSWVTSNGATGSNDQNWRSIAVNGVMFRSTKVPTYTCPSEAYANTQGSNVGGGWARGNYAANWRRATRPRGVRRPVRDRGGRRPAQRGAPTCRPAA